ncbi:hypothetical protein BLD48_05875 [Exiguobacterium sp. KRL4]|uniref:hypothetical protein n=1 Tax=Exiguobacterium sp. KRL4 TaxID=1914536 RepID=UPI0008F9179F|nr:hypothetical protein [Exiguobacterium sp. KRL4]OIN67415.1 hypothetical protein BLD48_05875 [Exiguobacterium sp. KRL4]
MRKFAGETWGSINVLAWFLLIGLPRKVFKEIKTLFHRDASVDIQYVSQTFFDEVGNKYFVRFPDTFKINIDTRKKRRTHWLAADFEDARQLLGCLDDKSLSKVTLQVGDRISSTIVIPRWAKKRLADQLRPHISYYSHLAKPYEKRGEA